MLSPAYKAILSNPDLPSLPIVALEVLELAAREDVELRTIEKTIERDQAIAVRILRTVNSSYYGLSNPCGSIRQAVALLGMQTVRGLVLGFSLESTLNGGNDDEVSFDFMRYWRRAFYSASAARLLAATTGQTEPEEAFIAALMQDMGMVATWRVHGDQYLQMIDMARGKHDELAPIERRILDIDHALLGAEMARGWRFPETIVHAIKSHHDELEEPCHTNTLTRVVRLAGVAAEVLDNEVTNSTNALADFERQALKWFRIECDGARDLLAAIADDARDLASALEINVGQMPNSEQVLARAAEMLAALPDAVHLERGETTSRIDVATGLPNREELLTDLEMSYRGAQEMNSCLSGVNLALLLIGIDDVREINERLGDAAGDAALAHVAQSGHDILAHLSGAVGIYRFVGAEIAIILRGFDESGAIEVAEELRATLARRPFRIEGRSGEADFCTVRVTIGVGVYHPTESCRSTATPDALLRASMCAVTSGRRDGGDRVALHDERFSSAAIGNVA